MRLPFRCLLAAPLVVATVIAQAPFSPRLLQDDSIWGDGKAEVTVFAAQEKRYGELRETEVRHIVVREDFAADAQVKADNWQAPGTYPVIKLNQIITVPTGTYRYDQGHSAFWRVSDGQLIKFASTTNDSCGLSYKQGNLTAGDWHYRAFTYWEGMSEVDTTAAAPVGALTYDELPFKLRTLDWGKTTLFEAPLLETVIDSKADTLAWAPAAFAIQRVPDGWRVTVSHAHGTDRLTFDRESPHTLRRWIRWDGSRLERTHTIRLPYWQLNQPGDEHYLQPGATYP
ncbi:hypothetical protein [Actomonas aquatica]|uniref:Uncharacterized protein n=1 Tax=Actomonas aquatica TaxID=2866162 RepID=A0ABZ1CCA7_9BACT|nr:hypothetical protein [Opitutus sp. WL0086]WRQ89072.1 hypothetical protein K1X11_006605 [Opitutus sp. WL0086]